MTAVVDTSVVIKWAIEEQGAEEARRFIGQPLVTPDLLIFELGHVLTKKVRRRELDAENARIAYRHLPTLVQLTPSRLLEQRAFDLALSLHHAIGDCYFLALAQSAEVELVTADEVFVRKVQAAGAGRIRLLGES